MPKFTIKLAGVPIEVDAIHGRVERMCEAYLCDEPAEMRVVSSEALIAAERSAAKENADALSDAYLEELVVYRQIAEQMAEHDVLLFHGSAVAADGNAYLFTADSGTGKSTHARFWREVLPEKGHDVFMVNDDKPLLKFADGDILVCGTPWDGKHHLSSNVMVPLKGLCFLSRGEENQILPLDGKEMLSDLMQHCFRPVETPHLLRAVYLLDRLSRQVPIYALSCNMEKDAALVSFERMRTR